MDHGLKTIKFFKIGENLQDLGLGKKFLGLTAKAQYRKGKINKLNLIKI